MRNRVLASISVAVLVAAAVTACGSSDPCPPVRLLAPDGSPFDLSGTWNGDDGGVYYIKQIDSCVWWSGLSNYEGQVPGETWVMTFRGHVGEDGHIEGDFVDVKSTNPGSGTLSINIRPDDLSLVKVGQTGHPVGVTNWHRADDSAPDQPNGPPDGQPT